MSATFYREETNRLFRMLEELTDENDRILVRNKIVELNIKLVTHIVMKYTPYTDDQFQIGCIGLIMAANTYELKREIPFSSYACFCIEREIQLAYHKSRRQLENQNDIEFVSLDAQVTLNNGDNLDVYDLTADTQAEEEMNLFIEENELNFVCDQIIKPCINEIADKGRHMQGKLDIDKWIDLEFAYIMDLIFIQSQKRRINLTQLARQTGISVTNIRNRHDRVMNNIFERMWHYMNLSFDELLQRLRPGKKLPERLLVFDPGKSTGWCLYENGKLSRNGEITDCYDDKNIDITGIMNLLQEIKPDFVLYEDYKVYSHKLERHTYSSVFAVRLIGLIETYIQMNNIPSHKQMAVTAKGFVTDEKLKQWGLWQVGSRHARDAIRHACYFLLFYKKGQDLV